MSEPLTIAGKLVWNVRDPYDTVFSMWNFYLTATNDKLIKIEGTKQYFDTWKKFVILVI